MITAKVVEEVSPTPPPVKVLVEISADDVMALSGKYYQTRIYVAGRLALAVRRALDSEGGA